MVDKRQIKLSFQKGRRDSNSSENDDYLPYSINEVKINPFHHNTHVKVESRSVDRDSEKLQDKFRDICRDFASQKLGNVLMNKQHLKAYLLKRYDNHIGK